MRGCVALLLIVWLAGCAMAPSPPLPADPSQIVSFELTGRIAVRMEGRGYSARLRWAHDIGQDAVWLYSPVGSVLATLTVDDKNAVLVTSDKETFQSPDVRGLTRKVLGWELPLEGLQHWVLARPDPLAPVEELQRDQQNRLRRLRQHQWTVNYLDYAGDNPLPTTMVLHYQDLRLKLVIDRWQRADAAG
jgi:outer membrane lipoprotein LolB